MLFDECIEGEYRIFVGALESPPGGYIAALVIKRRALAHGGGPGTEAIVYRDDSVACGYRWESADGAVAYALARGREFVRRQADELTIGGRAAA